MKNKIKAIKRSEARLHCRFCKETHKSVLLYETLKIRGIICYNCLQHLSSYIDIEIITKENKGKIINTNINEKNICKSCGLKYSIMSFGSTKIKCTKCEQNKKNITIIN